MWFKLTIALLFAGIAIPLVFSKNMYNLVHERAELLEWNDTLAKDVHFSFRKMNRTAFAFNVTFTTLRDVLDKKVMLGVYIDKLFGTEFKRTGTMLTLNMCKFWQRNLFGMRDVIQAHGNLEACDVYAKKYYLINFIPNEDMFPKILPFGSYRVEINVFHDDDGVIAKLFKMNWYARVEQLVRQQ